MLFTSLMKSVEDGGGQQADLSSEALAEMVEVETNAGLITDSEAIKILSRSLTKRAERILDALRSDASRPARVRNAAEKYTRNSSPATIWASVSAVCPTDRSRT